MTNKSIPGFYKRSGGPKTQSGRANSKLNALKLGAYSSMQLLPNERKGDYEVLHDALFEDLDPQTTLMHQMAVNIVNIVWRLKRLNYYEGQYFQNEYDAPIHEVDIKVALNGCWDEVQAAQRRG